MNIIRRLIYALFWRMTDYQMYGTGTINRTGYVGHYHLRGLMLARIRKDDGSLDFDWS